MSYMKLLKLLYLADRRALIEHGRPITYDRYVSMPQGPVLSQTYNLIVAEESPETPSYWRQFISEPDHYDVCLVQEAPATELSPAQEQLLEQTFAEFGHMNRWDLVRLTHELPEWEDPHGSSIPISIQDVLRAAGLEEGDIESIDESLAADEALAQMLD